MLNEQLETINKLKSININIKTNLNDIKLQFDNFKVESLQ